jgi:hypothetical protein
VFLIWAGHGAGEDINPHYYDSAGPPKSEWKIAEAGHTGGLSARPLEYEQRVIAFFDRTLLTHWMRAVINVSARACPASRTSIRGLGSR